MIRHFVSALTLFLFGNTTLQAQNDIGGWLMLFGDAQVKNAPVKFNYELQNRNHKFTSDLNQLLVRGNVQYTGIENLNLALGYAYVLSEKQEEPNLPFREHRIFQEVMTKQQLGKVTFRHRFRFEQRWFDEAEFRTRARYQFKVIMPWFEGEKGNSFYTTAYSELFINTNKTKEVQNVFDRNRVSLGKGYRFNKKFAVQAAYMVQLYEKGNDPQITVGIYHSI